METTPRARTCNSRYRRAPTPKMSERKKKLFDDVLAKGDSPTMRNPYVRLERIIVEEAEDSDIGPMSPLEFSSSPSSFSDVHRLIAREQKGSKMRRTNFSNILNEISSGQSPSTTTHSQTSNSKNPNKLDGIDVNIETKDNSEEDVVGPLCTSMKKLTSMTEQNYEQQMKTPNEVVASSKNVSEQVVRGATFRKSLVFDSGLTPHDGESNASSTIKSGGNEPTERPKAKTSLTFNEPTISVKSFYGKPVEKSAEKPVEETTEPNNELNDSWKINSHAFAAAIAKRKSKLKPKSKSKSLAKRMKAPSLWRFSGKIKFNRFKRHRSQKDAKKKKLNTSANDSGVGEKKGDNDSENMPPTGAEFTSRIEQNLRLQKILKDQTNSLNASRDINWAGGIKTNEVAQNQNGFLNSDAEDEDGSDNESHMAQSHCTYEEVEVEVEEPSNRKFFKSSASNSAKKYRIMGRLSATLKRGGDLKFDPMPKRKKKRLNKGSETVVLHNEITSIIDRLSSPSKEKPTTTTIDNSEKDSNKEFEVTKTNVPEMNALEVPTEICNTERNFIDEMQTELPDTFETTVDGDVEKYRRMIPFNTIEPEKISQQESILELLISNGICDDETFKIFIAEPDLHKEKASQILDNLYCVNTLMPNEYENESAIEWVNSIESPAAIAPPPEDIPISNETSYGLLDTHQEPSTDLTSNTQATVEQVSSSSTEGPTNDEAMQIGSKLFPIFNKNFSAIDPKVPAFNALNKTTKKWVPIGDQQYQLDVGQKAFGLRTCPQCEMQYSVHEPEDELLHLKYHNCVNILAFKGWTNENEVTQIPDWGLNGRIIFVCEKDGEAKKVRVKEILDMVDRDLGFAARTKLKEKTLVYLAIAKQQIVGVCVVQPLERAHRLKTENGVDCYTSETYPVKCGISRVWVAPQYRRHGIAAKLITSIRGHFLYGAFLTFDEIAFSSPTEDGKKFAAKLAQRSDILIYEK